MAITYERLRELRFLGVMPETECCANCEHFYQHYCKEGRPIFAGHCVYPRMKSRNPCDTCKHFKNKEGSYSKEKIDYPKFLADKPQETDPAKLGVMKDALVRALKARGVHGHVSAVYYKDGRVKTSVNGAYYGIFDTNDDAFFSGYVGD